VEKIRPFEYRPCRAETGFAVDFAYAGETLRGICWNVSDAGIRAEFPRPVPAGAIGLLTLHHPRKILQVAAHVAYSDHCQAGLVFRFQSSLERDQVIAFATSIMHG
jgi:hypothetical protein